MQLLICVDDKRACKVWNGEECEAYDCGFLFDHATLNPCNIHELAAYLEGLRDEPQVFVIRGKVKEGAPVRVRRKSKGDEAHVESFPRPWVLLDADKTSIPFDPTSPETSVRDYIATLPEGLREASCYWHLSASQHKHQTLRAHLWFFLDRPYGDKELKEALKHIHGIDPSVCNTVQPHYTSDPLFISGEDPLTKRSGLLRGLTDVGKITVAGTAELRALATDKLDKAVREIRKVCNSDNPRHPVINLQAYYLGQLCPHLLTEAHVYSSLFDAATSGKNPLDPDRASDEIRRGLEDGKSKPALVGEDWKGRLRYANKGYEVAPTLPNIVTILENDSRWSDLLAFDLRYIEVRLTRNPPFESIPGAPAPRPLEDSDGSRLSCWLQRFYQMAVLSSICYEALGAVSQENTYDPVKDWLESLEWDGQSRLASLPADMLGDPSVCASECFLRWMIAAVQRVYEPGCQSDYALVLEGPQGLRKTSFLKWLAGDYYRELTEQVTNKDSRVAMQGPWIADMSELSSFRKVEIEAIKAFLSATVDSIRMPYGRTTKDFPRRGVIAATTNSGPENPYLTDPTGSRRLWPILVGKLIVTPDEHARAQLWAEARTRYMAGESSWVLSDQAQEELKVLYSERHEDTHDTWIPTVRHWLEGREQVTAHEILRNALMIPPERQNPRMRQRVSGVLRVLGYRYTRIKSGDTRDVRVWVKG